MAQPVQSIQRAISILNEFSIGEPELSIGELSNRLKLPKTTIHRLINALEQGGFIYQAEENGPYRLGLGLIAIAKKVSVEDELRHICSPYLHRLSDSLEEAIILSILDGSEVLDIERSIPENRFITRSGSIIGRKNPAIATASGKAIIAFLPHEDVCEILFQEPCQAITPNTITQSEKILAELEKIREQGFATAFGELEIGLNAVAAPLFNNKERTPVASISVAGPSYRIDEKNISQIAETLLKVTHEISLKINY